jgi:RimJ/RimL family protein N-acetyltransferase
MVTVHPITPAFAATFKTVRLRALLDTPTAFGSTHAKEVQLSDADWLQRAAQWNGDRSMGYLAFDGENPCGIAAGFLDSGDPKKANLISMWVAPSYRGRGVGRLLVNGVLDWAGSRGAEVLSLMVTSNNDGAMRFYERLGFAKSDRTEPYPNDPALIEFEMIRRLSTTKVWSHRFPSANALQTPRLIIRRFRSEDWPDLHQLQGDPEATKFLGGFWSEDKTREVTMRIAMAYETNPWEWLAVADRATDRVLGACWLGPLNPKWCTALGWGSQIELGYRYAKQYWGKGYATEAGRAMLARGFGELKLPRIVAITDVGNAASERVIQKLGMKFVGGGTHGDVSIRGYAMDREQYGPTTLPAEENP